jgi:hypothetical protein
VVNVGVKSGSNAFHGSGYAYGRHDALDAVDVFTTRSPHHLVQYGASVGGPIKKDKLFFFGNYESQQYSIATPFNHPAPDTAAIPPSGDTNPAANSLVGACQAVLDTKGLNPNGLNPGGLTVLSEQLAGITVGAATTGHANGTCVMGATPGLFPATTGYSGGIPNSYTALVGNNTIYSGVGKLDYHINDKNSMSGVFFMSPGAGTFVDDPTHQVDPRWILLQTARAIVGSGSWTYSPSSTVVNSLRVGYGHYHQTYLSPDHTVPASAYGLNTGVTDPLSYGLPRTRITTTFANFQLGGTWPKFVGPDAVTHISDSVSWLHGNHSLKFGGEFLFNQSTNMATNNTKGPMNFSTLQSFFSGTFKSATLASGQFTRHLSSKGFALFVQDDWRVTRRLTVNVGVRYEIDGVPTDHTNGASLIGNFSPTAGLEQVGVGGYTRVYNPDYNNFSPRLGFAWDIAGNGKTVVRGGSAVIYEQGSYDSMMAISNNFGMRSDPTGVPTYTSGNIVPFIPVAGGTITAGVISYSGTALTGAGGLNFNWATNSANPLYSATAVCGDGTVRVPVTHILANPCTVVAMDQHIRTPYITTWNLGIQRALTNNVSLDVSYVGNHATKLVGMIDLNSARLGSGWTAAKQASCLASAPIYNACAPDGAAEVASQRFATSYPYLGPIYYQSNNNFSNYNALQVALTQHTWHGWSYVAGYTFSHALGESGDNWRFSTPIDINNVRQLYGSTSFDIRHRFTFAGTYAIPGMNAPAQLLKGWSINSVVTLQSAMPWGVNDIATDFSGSGQGGCCGNQIPTGNGISGGEQWNFFGNPADFKSSMALVGNNAGAGGIPYFKPGAVPGADPLGPTDPAYAINQTICTSHTGGPGTLSYASMFNLGCYVSPNGKSVLVPPAYGSQGNTGPFMFRGPAFYNVDFSVAKLTKFGERVSAQFRAEFFNIFNHPNIANPYGGPGGVPGTYTDPTGSKGVDFGFARTTPDVLAPNPVLGSGAARAVQLGLKLMF